MALGDPFRVDVALPPDIRGCSLRSYPRLRSGDRAAVLLGVQLRIVIKNNFPAEIVKIAEKASHGEALPWLLGSVAIKKSKEGRRERSVGVLRRWRLVGSLEKVSQKARNFTEMASQPHGG